MFARRVSVALTGAVIVLAAAVSPAFAASPADDTATNAVVAERPDTAFRLSMPPTVVAIAANVNAPTQLPPAIIVRPGPGLAPTHSDNDFLSDKPSTE